jgi:transposase
MTRISPLELGGLQEVTEETIREKRARRGRPRKDEQPPAETAMYRASVTIDGIDQGQVEQARERESCFALITNLMDADKYPASNILGEYKQQSRVEARFSFLKSPYLLGQVFLKKQSRIEALGYVPADGVVHSHSTGKESAQQP